MLKTSRRKFLQRGIACGTIGLLASPAHAIVPTPAEIEGPFYPVVAQKDRDFDLTRVDGREGVAKGQVIIVQGQVRDTEGQAVEDATVDLWQANAAGRYRHPHDANPAPLDPNFQGWAVVPSGEQGRFRFKTIIPGEYPASSTWVRPPHIHYRISKRGYMELTTQMYFPDHRLNAGDRLLQRKNSAERALMIARQIEGNAEIYEFNIVLQQA